MITTIFFGSQILPVYGQCTGCTVNVIGNNAPSSSIVEGSVVCISGDRTTALNFNNSSNITICISPDSSWDGSTTSLTSLSVINNYGNLTVSNSFNGQSWKINNYNLLSFNRNLPSGTTVNNYNIMRAPGNIEIAGTLNLAGTFEVEGTLHINGAGRVSALNVNQCNSVNVMGAFTTDGIITGRNLNYVGTGSGLFVNKQPEGNVNPPLTGGAKVGSCSTVNCVETISTKAAGRTDMVYIYRCSGTFTSPVMVDDQELSGVMLLMVAGGGGGGMGESAGGGGAGAMYESNNIELEPGSSYQVIVGSGGIGANTINVQGGNGSPSSFYGLMAPGGGGGGSSSAIGSIRTGRNGGSGGGGAASSNNEGVGGTAVGTFTTIGGKAFRNNSNVLAGGGGGGASSKGIDANPPEPGHGGDGRSSTLLADLNITTFSNRFSAGGGGTGRNSSSNPINPALGGSVNDIRIGGNGNNTVSGLGGVGISNTGSGGGAGAGGGGAGGPGVVVLRLSFGALPVEYAFINAFYSQKERKVDLHWATSKEWENSHFDIERSINNVDNWVKVGEVSGIGWSDEISEYEFKDTLLYALGGNYYYRLRQVDFNLEYEYSKTLLVNVPENRSNSDWIAYPNPFYEGDLLRIFKKLPSDFEKEIQIRVISSQSTVREFSASSLAEINFHLQKSVINLPQGLLILEVKWGGRTERIKIFKK